MYTMGSPSCHLIATGIMTGIICVWHTYAMPPGIFATFCSLAVRALIRYTQHYDQHLPPEKQVGFKPASILALLMDEAGMERLFDLMAPLSEHEDAMFARMRASKHFLSTGFGHKSKHQHVKWVNDLLVVVYDLNVMWRPESKERQPLYREVYAQEKREYDARQRRLANMRKYHRSEGAHRSHVETVNVLLDAGYDILGLRREELEREFCAADGRFYSEDELRVNVTEAAKQRERYHKRARKV